MSRYRVNQLVFLLTFSLLILLAGVVILLKPGYVWYPLIFLSVIPLMHYQYNIVHIATHNQVSKNRKINSFIGNLAAIIGGTTLASFAGTHLEHHKNPTDSEKDPDNKITVNTNFALIPFKVFYQDYFFWKKDLYKRSGRGKGYLLDRLIQAVILAGIILSGNLFTWLVLWTLPVYVVGYLNGIFLFFVPHYTTPRIEKWKKLERPNVWQKFCISIVYISLHYHLQHHYKVSQNRNYFPVYAYLQDQKLNLVSNPKLINQTL